MSDERLTDDEIRTLKKLAQEAQKDGINRRELMQAAGMTGLGALLGGGSTAALVGSASASASTSDSDGNVGLPSNRVDLFADGVDSKSVNTEQIGSEWYYAGAFDGADPDARLDNALTTASGGDTIHLENASYTANRTISTDVTIVGPGGVLRPHDMVSADWTLDAPTSLFYIPFDSSNTVTHNGGYAEIVGCTVGSINANEDGVAVIRCWGVDVTFASGTARGVADSLFGNSTVTDNGSNSRGTIG